MHRARAFFFICAGIFLLALAYHLGASGAEGQPVRNQRTVEAEKFVLRDRAGVVRGIWMASGDTAQLGICDEKQRACLTMGMRGGTSALLISDAGGRMRTSLGVDSDGDPSLSLLDGDGHARGGIGFLAGIPALTLSGTHKNIGAFLSVRSDDVPFLLLRDWTGRESRYP